MMGIHRKTITNDIIGFILRMGEALGYIVDDEEYMFPDERDSPILDVTWRKSSNDKFPLFIFEIESSATKASTDNALKVLSQKTDNYPKPLFLFHIFVDDAADRRRIENLRNQYDDVNYETFALATVPHHPKFVSCVVCQHFRVFDHIDLPAFLNEFINEHPLQMEVSEVLQILIDTKYDLRPGSNFLAELEFSLLEYGEDSFGNFYISYLPAFLTNQSYPSQIYPWQGNQENIYFRIVHLALVLLTKSSQDHELYFKKIQAEEDRLWGESFSKSYFGLSLDGDCEMYSEWPLVLSMLVLSFAGTNTSRYFSEKLRAFVSEAFDYFGFLTLHPLTWLAIASQVANDYSSYAFAAKLIDRIGGIPLQALAEPSIFSGFPQDDSLEPEYDASACFQALPQYNEWGFAIAPLAKPPAARIVQSALSGFLFRNSNLAGEGRDSFACFCLKSSVHSAFSRILT